MTEAHEVHLFGWIRENGPFLGPMFLLMIGMLGGWIKVMMSRYPLREELEKTVDMKLAACRIDVDKRTERIEKEQIEIAGSISELSKKIDRQDEQRREELRLSDLANSKAHEHILSQIMVWIRDK